MIKWINQSLFRRLLFSYLITVLLGLGVAGSTMSLLTKDHIYAATQDELLRKAKKVNLAIQNVQQIDTKTSEVMAFLDQSFDTRIWVFDRQGKIIATSMKDEVFTGKSVAPAIVAKILQGQDVITELQFEGLTKPMVSVAVPWGKENNIYGGIVLHAPVEGIDKTFGFLRETILWATLFGVLLSTAMVSYLSWSISRPLSAIERTAVQIGMGNYRSRIKVENSDKIGDLAQTINSLADRMEQTETDRARSEQVKNEFLTNISHELRTPLTSILGFLEVLQDDLVQEEETRTRYLQIIHSETLHLNRLVEDVMDLVKLENREIKLFKTPVDVHEVMTKTAAAFQQEAAKKHTVIEVLTDSDIPKIEADKHRVIQILKNLLQNAVKFTENGIIQLSASAVGQFVTIKVADTGIGIAADDIDRIWERFFKADRVRTKTNQGTGLGLAIVKQLVELHNGTISVSSEVGKGTEFTVKLPAVKSIS